jgi:hypothetical protein
MPRTIATIDSDLEAVRAEIARLSQMHATLLDERKAAMPVRDAEIIKAFDAGAQVKNIATDLDLTLNVVWQVLRKSGRTAKSRGVPISHLPAEQQRAYHKARKWGIAPGAARQMAAAVPA